MLGEQLKRSIGEVILPFEVVTSKGNYLKFAYTLDYEFGEYRQEALINLIRDSLINFALTPDEIRSLCKQNDFGELSTRAWSRISKARKNKKGDYGEILLYLITEYYFDAPKLVTKVLLKTSTNDQIKGFDCAHFSLINGDLTLFLGEAKLHKTFSSGLSSAIESLSEHCKYQYINDEFSILLPHVQVNEDVSGEIYERVRLILNRSVSLDKVNICIPILLAFDASEISQGISLSDELHIERLADMFKSKFSIIETKHLPSINSPKITFRFILLPFKSIDEFRDRLDRIEEVIKL